MASSARNWTIVVASTGIGALGVAAWTFLGPGDDAPSNVANRHERSQAVKVADAKAAGGQRRERANGRNEDARPAKETPDARQRAGEAPRRPEGVLDGLRFFPQSVRQSAAWPDTVGGLVWVLSTHPDPRLREGATALRLAEEQGLIGGAMPRVEHADAAAAAYAEVGRFERAVRLARRVVDSHAARGDHERADEARRRLAQYEMRQPLRDSSEVPVREVPETAHGRAAEVFCLLGERLAARERPVAAVWCFVIALEFDPLYRPAHLALGMAGAQAGVAGKAVEHLHLALKLRQDAPTAARLGRVLRSLGDVGGAARLYRQSLELDPSQPAVANDLAWLLATHLGEAREAVRLAEVACRATGRRNADMLETLAVALAAEGRFEEAAATIEEALPLLRENDSRTPAMQGRLELFREGEPYHSDLRMWLRLGDLALKSGDLDEAERHFQRALAEKADSGRAMAALGRIRRLQGETREAVRWYRQALAADPNLVSVANDVAWILATDPDPLVRDAPAALRVALRVCGLSDRRPVAALDTLAAAYAANGRFEEAVVTLQAALGGVGTREAAVETTAMEQRLKLYEARQPFVAGDPAPEIRMAAKAMMEGDPSAAVEQLREAVSRRPSDARLWFLLGRVHRESGAASDAARCYQRALELEPDLYLVANDLAWLLATHPDEGVRDPVRAASLAERVCRADGHAQPATLDTLAAAYAAGGRFDEAVATIRRAMLLVADSRSAAPEELAILQDRLNAYLAQSPLRIEAEPPR